MSEKDVRDARAYADSQFVESVLAPENERFAEIAEEAFLAGRISRTPTEPSDAQVHAGWVAINGALTQDQVRAALRAAAGVQ